LLGDVNDNCLYISNTVLKENKARYMPLYQALLNEIGIDIEKGKTGIRFIAENDIIHTLKLLAEKVPININPWTPYALINFACCSFTGDFNYLLARVDKVRDLNGLLLEIQNNCLEKGYEQNIKCSFGASGIDFGITFHNKVGGFVIGYSQDSRYRFCIRL
jgi:hypothetical protein